MTRITLSELGVLVQQFCHREGIPAQYERIIFGVVKGLWSQSDNEKPNLYTHWSLDTSWDYRVSIEFGCVQVNLEIVKT